MCPAGFQDVVEGMLMAPGHKNQDGGMRHDVMNTGRKENVVHRDAYLKKTVDVLLSNDAVCSPAALSDAEMGQAGVRA